MSASGRHSLPSTSEEERRGERSLLHGFDGDNVDVESQERGSQRRGSRGTLVARARAALAALLASLRPPAALTADDMDSLLADYLELLAMLDIYAELTITLPLPRDDRHSGATPRPGLAGGDERHVHQEDALVALSKALHTAGCPIWRLNFNLEAAARGLGLPGTQFGVFPSFILVSFPRPERSSKPGGRTLYVPTTPGLNVAALDDVDAVARRVASFATNTATPFKRRPLAGGGAAAAGRAARDPAAALASPAASLQVAARAAALRGRFRGEAGREELGRAILDLASAGPGFYLYGKFVDRGLDGVEACWGEDATLHGPPTPSGSQRGGSGAAAAAAAVGAVPQQRRLSADVACASVDAAAHPLAPLPEAASSSSVAAAGPHLPPLHPASAAAAAYPGWPRSPGRGVNGGGGGDGALPPPSPHERRQRHAARRAHFAALACDEALVGLALVRAAPQLFTPGQQVAALAVASFGCAPAFFGGSWADGALAGALGGAVALLGCAASHTTGDRLARAYEFLAAVLCAFVARFVDGLVAHMCYSAVVLSALIWLVQGWTMTNAVVEIATRNPMSGTAHLLQGIIVTAMLGFGLDTGSVLADGLGVPTLSNQATSGGGSCANPVSEAFYPLLFLPVSLSFSLMLNARVSQLPAMTALSCAAFFLSWSLSRYAKLATLASFLSAIAIGCGGNLYSNATGKPALAATASGIFILVPGCFALRSIVSELGGQTGGSLGLSTAILTVAVSIGAGIFVSSLVVVPKEVVYIKNKQLKAGALHGGYVRRLNLSPVSL